MEIKFAQVYFWKGKFYIPSHEESEGGLIVVANPVYELNASVDIQQLTKVIELVLHSPRPRIPEITRDEWKKRKDPILIATGAKSWKELTKNGAMYAIGWTSKEKRLDISRTDKLEWDAHKAQLYSVDTPIEVIVKAVLNDLKNVRELL